MTLLAPGMWLQRLTTREPSLDQLESRRALRESATSRAPQREREAHPSAGLTGPVTTSPDCNSV